MSAKDRIKIALVMGPTASGKTKLAVNMARLNNGEIISADSRQVYKGMDIGSGKDLREYGNIRHHLIDIVSPLENYDLACFRRDAILAISDIHDRGKLPLICGGSIMYIDCLVSEYSLLGCGHDEVERERLKKLDCHELILILGEKLAPDEARNKNRLVRRIERKFNTTRSAEEFPFVPEWLLIGVLRDRKEIHRRIEERLRSRVAEGMIEEVCHLHESGVTWEKLEYFGLEYKYIARYLQEKLTYDEMLATLLVKIRNLARRQDIWFRKMERKGLRIHWIRDGNFDESNELLTKFLNGESIPEPDLRIAEIFYGRKTS